MEVMRSSQETLLTIVEVRHLDSFTGQPALLGSHSFEEHCSFHVDWCWAAAERDTVDIFLHHNIWG